MEFKKIFRFLSNNLIIQIVNIALSLVAVKLLSVSDLGKYNLAKGLAGSFQYSTLGLRYSLDRKLPLGQEKYNKIKFQISFLIHLIVSALLLGFYVFLFKFVKEYLVYCLGGFVIASFFLIRVYYRGIGKTNLFISSTLWSGVVPVVIPIVGLYFAGLWGLCVGYLTATLLIFFIYFDKSLFLNFFYKPSIRYLQAFFKIGFPIFLTNIILYLADNLDKFIINYYLSIDAVGEYAVITLAYTLAIMLPTTIFELLFPEYIRNKKSEKFSFILKKHTYIMLGLMAVFLSISYFALPFVINLAFPKYSYLVSDMRLIIFALVPYVFISPVYAVLFAFDKRVQIVRANIITVLIYFIALYYFLANGYSMTYVVCCKILYSSVYAILLLFILWKEKLFKLSYKSFVSLKNGKL